MAVIALTRLNGYTNNPEYHKKAQQTLNALAGAAHQYGIFVSTYAIAAVHFSQPHTQVVVVGNDEQAEKLRDAALANFSYGKAVIKINADNAVAQGLPPALAETVPQLPAVKKGKTVAIVCRGFACQPPVASADDLSRILEMST